MDHMSNGILSHKIIFNCIIIRFTIFDNPEDDIFDGNIGINDEEKPRVLLKFTIQNIECSSEFRDLQTEMPYDSIVPEQFNLLKENVSIQNISPEKLNVSPYKKISQAQSPEKQFIYSPNKNYSVVNYLNGVTKSPNPNRQKSNDENVFTNIINQSPSNSKEKHLYQYGTGDNSPLVKFESLNETLSSRLQSNYKKFQDSDKKDEFSAKLYSYLIEKSNNAGLIQSVSSICSSQGDLETLKIFKKY